MEEAWKASEKQFKDFTETLGRLGRVPNLRECNFTEEEWENLLEDPNLKRTSNLSDLLKLAEIKRETKTPIKELIPLNKLEKSALVLQEGVSPVKLCDCSVEDLIIYFYLNNNEEGISKVLSTCLAETEIIVLLNTLVGSTVEQASQQDFEFNLVCRIAGKLADPALLTDLVEMLSLQEESQVFQDCVEMLHFSQETGLSPLNVLTNQFEGEKEESFILSLVDLSEKLGEKRLKDCIEKRIFEVLLDLVLKGEDWELTKLVMDELVKLDKEREVKQIVCYFLCEKEAKITISPFENSLFQYGYGVLDLYFLQKIHQKRKIGDIFGEVGFRLDSIEDEFKLKSLAIKYLSISRTKFGPRFIEKDANLLVLEVY